MKRFSVLLFAVYLAGQAAPSPAGELHCRTYWKNSLSGVKAYTDCGDGPFYGYQESDGISWFYGFRRVEKYLDDKKADLRYNRDLFLKTGMTPSEVDRLMRARDAGAVAPPEMAADKINLDLAALASSELFVYSSTEVQKGLADLYYSVLLAQPQIAAKTAGGDKARLRERLEKLSPDLERLGALLDSFVAAETPRLGTSLDAFRAAKTGAAEAAPGVYTLTKEQVGAGLKLTYRFLEGKLVSAMLSFAPLANAWTELEQLRLLLNRKYGWPLSCAAGARNEISCRWEDKAGNAAAIGSEPPGEGAGELTVTLISTKVISDLAEKPAASGN